MITATVSAGLAAATLLGFAAAWLAVGTLDQELTLPGLVAIATGWLVAFTTMQQMKAHKALLDMSRRDLARWARVNAERDQLVRQARASGLGVNEITRITGLAKTTVIRILAEA